MEIKTKVNNFQGHALCQALKLEGVSDRTEANIESCIRQLWETNGPDFALGYLKVLKTDTEKSLVDVTYRYHHENGEISVSWNHKEGRPKGPLGCIYKQFPKPTERIHVIGAMIYSVTYESATPKQIQKFIKGIQSKTRAEFTIDISDEDMIKLESSLESHVMNVRPFGMTDLTNDYLPYAQESFSTMRAKQIAKTALDEPTSKDGQLIQTRSKPEVHKAIGELHAHKLGQFYTAPSCCKKYWNDVLHDTYLVRKIPDDLLYPRKVSPRPFEARDYETNPDYGYLCMVSAEYSPRGKADYLGRLDFVQKEGGKLRSICNTNRYVNWTTAPFAKALEDVYYHRPEIFVKDQKEGLRKIQEMLTEGRTLVSLDLTSATDTLDFRVFTRALKKHHPFYYTKVAQDYGEYFETLAELPMWCDPLDCAVQFQTGQPLGMKGSFQVLTVMNWYAGRLAERESGLVRGKGDTPNFLVVGDDFICDSRMADAYVNIITSWGGKTNMEKSMISKDYGEFLSHIVSKDLVYETKPKFRLGCKEIYSNLEKGKKRNYMHLYRLSKRELDTVAILSEYSVDEMDYRNCLPNFRSKDLSLDDYSLELMAVALTVVSELKETTPQELTISKAALEYIYLEDPTIIEKSSNVPVIRDKEGVRFAQGNTIRESIATIPTSVEMYDHKTARTREKVSKKSQKLLVEDTAKTMRSIKEAFNGDSNKPINLGYGKQIRSEDLVFAAMQAIDPNERSLPNRSHATKSLRRTETLTRQVSGGTASRFSLEVDAAEALAALAVRSGRPVVEDLELDEDKEKSESGPDFK